MASSKTKDVKNYPCDFCAAPFKSRSARLYHRRNSCTKNPESKAYEKPAAAEQDPPGDPDPDPQRNIAENKRTFEDQMKVTIPDRKGEDPDVEVDPPVDEDLAHVHDYWIYPVIILVIFIAGCLIFRDKLLSLFGLDKKPPGKKGVSA